LKKDTIVIAYPAGCYGTYVNWIVDQLRGVEYSKNPFTSRGSSHNLKGPADHGYHVNRMDGWDEYADSDYVLDVVRVHPKTQASEDINRSLQQIASQAEKVIYIEPTEDTLLHSLNNQFYKTAQDPWEKRFAPLFDNEKIFNQWGIVLGNPVPTWVQREYLSYYLPPMFLDQIEYGVDHSSDDWLVITVDNLLLSINQTVNELGEYLGLNSKINIAPAHMYNVGLQKFLGIDFLANFIVDSTIDALDFNWTEQTLISEAWIQWKLRQLGHEIKCDGLDNFPTNSLQLADLLYKA
jgi:hypothetical protein